MPSLYLTTPGTRANLVSQHLEIELPFEFDESESEGPPTATSEAPRPFLKRVPLHDVEHVVVSTRATLSLAAQAALAERTVPIVIVNGRGEAVAHTLPPAGDLPTRLSHYQRRLDSAFGLEIARSLVEAKIANSRRLLQRLAANRKQSAPAAVARLEPFRAGALRATDVDTLRGYEGSAAGAYFEALAGFFPASAPFERRSRRPPHNAANAVLSYAYSLLVHETATALHLRGLDPGLGFLHEAEPHRPALALDLIEPFRAPVADGLALDLFNHSTLDASRHFHAADGGIYLNLAGRRRFFTAYERRMDRPFTSELSGERTTLRQEIHRQVMALKKHLREGGGFTAFIMN